MPITDGPIARAEKRDALLALVGKIEGRVNVAAWGPEGIEIDNAAGGQVCIDVLNERGRQDAKWGPQHHPVAVPTMPWGHYGVPTADQARATCDRRATQGLLTWTDIALEEFCEMIEVASAGDLVKTRVEAVQTIAVLVAMVEDMDRNATIRCGYPVAPLSVLPGFQVPCVRDGGHDGAHRP